MKTRRILSVVLALMFVLSTLTFASVSVSAATSEVYVDQINGNDSASGAVDAPLNSFSAAFQKVDDGGTVYVIGTYEMNGGHFPGTAKKLTIAGADASAMINTSSGAAMNMNSDLAFADISILGGGSGYAHLNTAGYKLTLLEGFKVLGSGQIHASTPGSSSAGEHIVIDGVDVTSRISLGGAYIASPSAGIMGDVTVEVLSGSLKELTVAQDGWQESHKSTTITGNLNVRVGAAGTIKGMVNTGRYANVKGYFQLILEDGGSMCDLDLTNFDHKEIYKVTLSDTKHGNVNFTETAGVFALTYDEGYLAKIETASGTVFTGADTFEAALGEEVKVSFTNEKTLAPAEVDVIIAPATPGTTEWPVSVSDATHFEATVNAVSPDHATVGYAIPYTYDITLATTSDYVFPAGFAFTINGSSEYRIEVLDESYDSITFTYTAAETAKDETRAMISYVGGIGTAGTAPFNAFADFNSTITVDAQYFTQGGYAFAGYSDGTNVYQPGDDYTVGTEDVVFTAVWEKLDAYQVVFGAGGATGGYAPTTLESYAGMYVTVPENTYANTGYIFTYWTDENDKVYNPGDLLLVPEANVYLEANWEVNPIAGQMIYVDVINGLDSNDGSAADKAVATLAQAIALANGGDVTVIVIGNLSIANMPETAGNVTITGYDTDAALMIASSVVLGSATNIENIKIDAKSGAYIATNGYKAVIGPNLENIGATYDVVDGGIDTVVENVDTTINAGVTVGTYYLGGANLTDDSQGISGNVHVNINGAAIDTIDFSPKGGAKATIGGYMVFSVNAGDIGNFVSTTAYVTQQRQPAFIFFNNGTIPEISTTLKNQLKKYNANTFLVDSGIGGAVEFTPGSNGLPQRNGRVQATQDTTYDVYVNNGTGFSKKTSYFSPNKIDKANITQVRYGTEFTSDIAATITAPTGGAEAFSITATPNDASIVDVVSIQLVGWTPDLVGGKFSYETQYTANILVTLSEGYFFNDAKLPAIILNDEAVDAAVNTDGTLSASYAFAAKTGYAPQLNATFFTGDSAVVGDAPAAQKWDHMSINKLPSASSMSNLGYRFTGWKCSEDGVIYRAGADYAMTGNVDVEFTAQWSKRGSWELPNVLILYDLSAYGRDKGRNPGFAVDDSPIMLTKAFENLEYEVNGTKATTKTSFDHEEGVVKIVSDGKGKAFTINDWSMERVKAEVVKYPYITIIYYYESTKGAAVGDRGNINFGNVKLADGTNSNWYGKVITADSEVVANKWACMTFDLTSFIAENAIPEGALYRQCHISPIGGRSLSELAGDTLYLKALYFSQSPAITK